MLYLAPQHAGGEIFVCPTTSWYIVHVGAKDSIFPFLPDLPRGDSFAFGVGLVCDCSYRVAIFWRITCPSHMPSLVVSTRCLCSKWIQSVAGIFFGLTIILDILLLVELFAVGCIDMMHSYMYSPGFATID